MIWTIGNHKRETEREEIQLTPNSFFFSFFSSPLSSLPTGGREIIRSSAFLRLLSYMLAVGQWRHHVNAIEEAVGDLLGVWEDDEFL